MAHVTFVHGISNKPAAADLLGLWRRAFEDDPHPLALGDLGVSTSLVYWADVLYAAPDPNLAAHESQLENTVQAVDAAGDAPPIDPNSSEEAKFVAGLTVKLLGQLGSEPVVAAADAPGKLERVPLPWFLKKRILAAFLRDVHHYLFDVEFEPRPGVRFRTREEIRRRFVAALGEQRSGPHVVVSHSLGTVIAYDCLKNVPECPPIDALVTVGSPLGLDEVQDRLAPGWSKKDGFPHEKLRGAWLNVFDPMDPVCGLDPRLANDFRRAGAEKVRDEGVDNPGTWPHSATKYWRRSGMRTELRRLLGV